MGIRSTSILTILALFLLGASPAPVAEKPDVRSTLLLFVAAWCAPCHKELAVLPELVAAAAPLPVRIVPLDSGPAKDAMLRKVPTANRLDLGEQGGRDLFFAASGLPLGLPASVLIGSDGKRCAQANRPLNARRVRELMAACASTASSGGG